MIFLADRSIFASKLNDLLLSLKAKSMKSLVFFTVLATIDLDVALILFMKWPWFYDIR